MAHGTTFNFEWEESKEFPNTVRTITVYIPDEYKSGHPACVYVGLDGLGFNAPIVFDNLIAQHAMPVTIAIGLTPGRVDSANAPENPRFDRSFEFDSRSGQLARFLIDEVLPEVQRRKTPSGDAIVLSSNPNDRAIGGASTGGIGAFTVAWERPDAFLRVFTSIGTFVGMRGGEGYYVEVRKTEPKPLRIFMQDGAYDEWGGGPEIGDWWMSNRTMERALEFAGYDVNHVWGVGTHNGNQATQVFPDAMRWLWRDWPAAITPKAPGNPVLKAILKPNETWNIAADGCAVGTALAADPQGKVFYAAGADGQIAEMGDSTTHCTQTAGASAAIAFGPDGAVYASLPGGGIRIGGKEGRGAGKIVSRGLPVRNFTVRNSGAIYATVASGESSGELWQIDAAGKASRIDGEIKGATGLAFSPDGLWLFVAQNLSRSGLSYRVRNDGTLDSRERLYDFYVPTWADDSAAGAVAMDQDGRAYVGTRAGVQVFDRNGRVTAILPLPGEEAATSVCFGGTGFDTLYVTAGNKIYRRKMKVPGTPPWAPAHKLPPWGAG